MTIMIVMMILRVHDAPLMIRHSSRWQRGEKGPGGRGSNPEGTVVHPALVPPGAGGLPARWACCSAASSKGTLEEIIREIIREIIK